MLVQRGVSGIGELSYEEKESVSDKKRGFEGRSAEHANAFLFVRKEDRTCAVNRTQGVGD